MHFPTPLGQSTLSYVQLCAEFDWVGMHLQEVEVNDEDIIQQLMEHSNANRSTGSTGANSESSRSHSIMQVSHCRQHRPAQL